MRSSTCNSQDGWRLGVCWELSPAAFMPHSQTALPCAANTVILLEVCRGRPPRHTYADAAP